MDSDASGAVITELPNGRVHANHGPIDLIITIDAPAPARVHALRLLRATFSGLLTALVVDLETLRKPLHDADQAAALATTKLTTPTSRRMVAASAPMAARGFITPMAAVAGSVADTICDAMWHPDMQRLIVNNGGDIAFRLAENTSLTVALADVVSGALHGGVRIAATDRVRGVASSGRHGRSLTMGIADTVTVLARTSATADAAATFIASNVDVPSSPRIRRRPAVDLDANSDLGDQLVVVDVEPLTVAEKQQALQRGIEIAQDLLDRDLIIAVALKLDDLDASLARERHWARSFDVPPFDALSPMACTKE